MKISETDSIGKTDCRQRGSTLLYETRELKAITGLTLRPGGLVLTERAIDFCGLSKGDLICDVGCGLCGTIKHLASTYQMRAIGIDPSRNFLSATKKALPGLPMVQGVAESLPFRSNTCDAVICECTLSLVKSPGKALAEFARILKPKGYLIISDMYLRSQDNPPRAMLRSCVSGAKTRQEMERFVVMSGFFPIVFEDHTSLLKHLAVQLIFAYGSLKALNLSASCGGIQEVADLENRIGYCLLIAKKMYHK